MAFPGSMIGAFLSGVVYMKFSKKLCAVFGEIFGTGILGGLVAFPVSKFLLGKDITAFFYVIPFLASTIGGSIIAYLILKVMDSNKVLGKINFQR
jgi:energy coupling factor transporter S component ThiW